MLRFLPVMLCVLFMSSCARENTVPAADSSADNDSADVAGDPETGGACTTTLDTCFDGTGGLDQNIYAAGITP